MTVRDALAVYRRYAPDLAPSTYRRIDYEVRRWEKLSAAQRLADIGIEDFTDFRDAARRSGLASRSIESNVDTVHLLLSTAHSLGKFKGHVPAKGRRLRKTEKAPAPVTAAEIDAIAPFFYGACWPLVEDRRRWWQSWAAHALWTGLRLDDLTWELGVEHYFADSIRFRAAKTRKMHVFPIHDILLANKHFLRNRPGHSPHLLRRQLAAFCRDAGIRTLVPKNFRQGAVTLWSVASEQAGKIVHGCGLPSVMAHYLDPLPVLAEAAPRFRWPESLAASPVSRSVQLMLF